MKSESKGKVKHSTTKTDNSGANGSIPAAGPMSGGMKNAKSTAKGEKKG